MIELREIGGDVFVVGHEGRRELIATPMDARGACRARIALAGERVDGLRRQIDAGRAAVKLAVLDDADSAGAHDAVAELERELEGATAEHRAAEDERRALGVVLDRHAAKQIQAADGAQIAALVIQFDKILAEVV